MNGTKWARAQMNGPNGPGPKAQMNQEYIMSLTLNIWEFNPGQQEIYRPMWTWWAHHMDTCWLEVHRRP